MEREKRQTKLPQVYVIPKVCFPRIRKKKPKKKPLIQANYQLIPNPFKFVYSSELFALYGDIGLKLTGGTLINETGVLNEYLSCRGVEIIREQTHNIVTLAIEKKFQLQLPAWQHMVDSLQQYEDSELKGWAERIKRYSLQHEEYYRFLQDESGLINGLNEQDLLKITEETNKKIQKLFSQYPCISFTSTQGQNTAKAKDICFNEQYLQELGYSLDSFASIILQEGLPIMLPTNTAYCAKFLIDNFYSLKAGGIDTPDIISDLTMKNGYTKKIRFKIFNFPSYSGRAYNHSAVFVILGTEKTDPQKISQSLGVNAAILKKIISKEKEINKFMKKYYNKTLNLPYSSGHKVCKIKELTVEENELDWNFEER